MFELLQLHGRGDEGIALQTRTGEDIPNLPGVDVTDEHVRYFEQFLTDIRLQEQYFGEMTEWPIVRHWKCYRGNRTAP